MSQYTHIFINKGQEFLEISCTGRGAALSEMFQPYAPWEKIHLVTYKELTQIYSTYKDELDNWYRYLAKKEANKALVATFNNSIDEKRDAIAEYDEAIEETQETIDELKEALTKLLWLIDIAHDDNGVEVYAGTECGSDVSIKDRDDYAELNLQLVKEETEKI